MHSCGLPGGLGTPAFWAGIRISVSTDYYHGLLTSRLVSVPEQISVHPLGTYRLYQMKQRNGRLIRHVFAPFSRCELQKWLRVATPSDTCWLHERLTLWGIMFRHLAAYSLLGIESGPFHQLLRWLGVAREASRTSRSIV
jgi:hypothetical protein